MGSDYYINQLGQLVLNKRRKLEDIETTEVSFADKPATGKKFLFFKRKGESQMETEVTSLLDAIEYIEKNFELTGDETENLDNAIKALSKMDSEEVEAVSNMVLLLSKMFAAKPEVRKAADIKWPSLTNDLLIVTKARAGIDVEDAAPNDTQWPSLTVHLDE
jgi:hypothetical protein